MSFFGNKVCVFSVFLENDKTDLRQFFSGFRRKHLFITTCIEKHCTRPLRVSTATPIRAVRPTVTKQNRELWYRQLRPNRPMQKKRRIPVNIILLVNFVNWKNVWAVQGGSTKLFQPLSILECRKRSRCLYDFCYIFVTVRQFRRK